MKALIWIACIVGASIVQVLLKYMGIGGAIPAMLVYGGMYASARTLCQKYDKRKAQRATEKAAYTNHNVAHTTHVEEISIPATNASHPPIVFCRNYFLDAFCSSIKKTTKAKALGSLFVFRLFTLYFLRLI